MRQTRSVSFPANGGEGIVPYFRRHLAILAGLSMAVATIGVAATLATWTVADPSFSHATKAAPKNVLGYPGAIVSDLLMQFLGVASIALLVPPGIWAWQTLFLASGLPRRRAIIAWGLSSLAASGALAAIPVPATWPLPTGLGGVTGDLLLRWPQLVMPAGAASAVSLGLACLCGVLAFVLFFYSCGMRLGKGGATRASRPRSSRIDAAPLADAATEATDRPHILTVTFGAILHGAYRAGTLLRRAAPAVASLRARLRTKREEEAAPATRDRIEPQMDGSSFPEEADLDDLPPPVERKVPVAKAAKPVKAAKTQPVIEGIFRLPPMTLLAEPKASGVKAVSADALEQNARLLEGVLDDFGVRGEIVHVRPGPVVTLYELEPAPGIKSSRVIGLADDIARSMSAIACRVAVIPGKNAIGIELPNARRETVYFREMVAAEDFGGTKARLPLGLGKTIGGEPVVADLAKMPHLLIAGTTGSGKSVAINTMILSLLYRLTPSQCRLIMIDPKMLELSTYEGIPHLLTPVVTDPKKAVVALKWTVREMEDRYRKMSKVGVRNIDGLNAKIAEAAAKGETLNRTVQTGFDRETGQAVYEQEELALEPMPYIVVIIDEMADLMMVAGKDIEGAVQRLAQMARAAGIHVIMATQRPSVDVITGTIKANFPTRISFQVTSKIDSRTILGEQGAEQLLGQGDMLYMMGGGRISRVHGPFVSDAEVDKVVAHLRTQGVPDYLDAITADTGDDDEDGPAGGDLGEDGEESADLYDKAVAVVLRDRKASTSYIQRRLQIGYNRAASIIERMEKEGLVGTANHAGKREILVEAREEEF